MFWETHSTSSASFFLLLHLTISQNPSVLLLGSVCCSFSLWPLWGIDGDKGALLILSWTQWTLSRLTTLVSLYNTTRKFYRMPRLIQCSSNSIHWCRLPHKHDLPTLTFFNFTLFPRQHFSYNRCDVALWTMLRLSRSREVYNINRYLLRFFFVPYTMLSAEVLSVDNWKLCFINWNCDTRSNY